MERTLIIVKPDGVRKNLIAKVLNEFEKNGLEIIGLKMKRLTKKEAEEFYAVHKGKVFFEGLVDFMISGPIVLAVLQGENAVKRAREIMGATEPKKAAKGTIRNKWGGNLPENIVHGSDSLENAQFEISFYFSKSELKNF